MCVCVCVSCSDGKFPRAKELNTDIVTWARLVARADKVVIEAGSSPNIAEGKEDRSKSKVSLQSGPEGSPPLSPLIASGESTPKSPLTPPPIPSASGMAQGEIDGTAYVCTVCVWRINKYMPALPNYSHYFKHTTTICCCEVPTNTHSISLTHTHTLSLSLTHTLSPLSV